MQRPLPPPPAVLLILGTDAAGKDHVADFLIRRWRDAGVAVERRAGGFSSPTERGGSSTERKGFWGRGMEAGFLLVFPMLRPVLRRILPWMIRRDLGRLNPGGDSVVVVSHTAIRLAAFVEAGARNSLRDATGLHRVLDGIRRRRDIRVLMLRVPPRRREERIHRRIRDGTADPFDRLMLRDPGLALRFEESLIHLAVDLLGAEVIDNNDLSDGDLERETSRALAPGASSPPSREGAPTDYFQRSKEN